MDLSDIKKAMVDYGQELSTEKQAVKTSFARIAAAQANTANIEVKWDDLEAEINKISIDSVKDFYIGELTLMRAEKDTHVATLEALAVMVESAGMMM